MASPPTPHLSMTLANFSPGPTDWTALLARARAFDAAGVDRLVVADHVVFGEALEDYGRSELGGDDGGTQPTGPDGHWLEPMTLLSVVAGQTTRVRLATGVLLAALRRPAVLAKSAATLDVLSGGRLDLGVGIGWQRAEYEASGLDFGERGDLLDHTLEVCQLLWREPVASIDSPRLRFERIHQCPKPVAAGGVPVWVSGRVNRRVVDRVVRFGDGWIPWGDDARNPAPGIEVLREALSTAGRDAAALQVTGSLPAVRAAGGGIDVDRTMAQVPVLAAAGLTDLRLRIPLPSDRAEVEDVLGPVVAAFREAAGR